MHSLLQLRMILGALLGPAGPACVAAARAPMQDEIRRMYDEMIGGSSQRCQARFC